MDGMEGYVPQCLFGSRITRVIMGVNQISNMTCNYYHGYYHYAAPDHIMS